MKINKKNLKPQHNSCPNLWRKRAAKENLGIYRDRVAIKFALMRKTAKSFQRHLLKANKRFIKRNKI